MASDKRYLEFHGAQWRVQVKVPTPLRRLLGKSKLVEPLHTASLALANKRRWPIVHKFRRMIEDADRQLQNGSSLTGDALVREALQWRLQFQARSVDEEYADFAGGGMVATGTAVLRGYLSDRAEEIATEDSPVRASLFHGIASGQATPVMMLTDQWLAEKTLKPRQTNDYRRAVVKFDGWLSAERKPVVVERVTRKIAGEYVSSRKQAGGDSSTINKDISALSTYWRWLEGKGYVSDNVWSRQSLPKKKVSRGEGKRWFRDDEMRSFLNADASELLHDAIRFASLSGMRVEEIARLRVGHCRRGVFEIHEAKTGAGERIVPIHSRLESLVTKRTNGKKLDDYLFHELPTPISGSAVERSQKISKKFTAFRRRLGLDDRREGARQARADFHSFRRWFAHKAKQALTDGATGFTPWTIAQVVGHEGGLPLGMTMIRYAGDDEIKALRACVEAVRLPDNLYY